jgi:uncharacterized membrane protein YbaN (DUF454 family)
LPATRWCLLLLAYLCAGLAIVGLVVPGLPTVPFLLVASWAAARGSPRLHAWLHCHRHLGPALRDWESQRAIGARAKCSAVVLLALSWAILAWRVDNFLLLTLTGGLFVAVATFVLTRPSPKS